MHPFDIIGTDGAFWSDVHLATQPAGTMYITCFHNFEEYICCCK